MVQKLWNAIDFKLSGEQIEVEEDIAHANFIECLHKRADEKILQKSSRELFGYYGIIPKEIKKLRRYILKQFLILKFFDQIKKMKLWKTDILANSQGDLTASDKVKEFKLVFSDLN